MNLVRDLEQDRAPGGNDAMLAKLRERLREKEKALEVRFHFLFFIQYISCFQPVLYFGPQAY